MNDPFRIIESDGNVVHASVETGNGPIEVIFRTRMENDELFLHDVHIDGPGRGHIGTAGLLRAAKAVVEYLDVKAITLQGFQWTTGARPGHTPKPFKFRR